MKWLFCTTANGHRMAQCSGFACRSIQQSEILDESLSTPAFWGETAVLVRKSTPKARGGMGECVRGPETVCVPEFSLQFRAPFEGFTFFLRTGLLMWVGWVGRLAGVWQDPTWPPRPPESLSNGRGGAQTADHSYVPQVASSLWWPFALFLGGLSGFLLQRLHQRHQQPRAVALAATTGQRQVCVSPLCHPRPRGAERLRGGGHLSDHLQYPCRQVLGRGCTM